MKLQLFQIKLPKLPKVEKAPINQLYIIGKILNFKLPKSYLSYLDKNFTFLVSWVSKGKYKVGTQTPINKGFGKLGKVFCTFLTLQILFSCQNSEEIEPISVQKVTQNNSDNSRLLGGTTPLDIPLDFPILQPSTFYIRYNRQDDEFSINGGPWFLNPYAYEDCDQQLICAIQKSNCQIEFHSGLYKMSNPIPLQVPLGINVYYYNLVAETIVFNNPSCTYFTSTDIVHFNVTFVPY